MSAQDEFDLQNSKDSPIYQGEPEPEKGFDLSEIDNIEFEDIDHNDYPDFCDAFVSSADYKGEPMTEDQLTDLNENYVDFCRDKLMSYLF